MIIIIMERKQMWSNSSLQQLAHGPPRPQCRGSRWRGYGPWNTNLRGTQEGVFFQRLFIGERKVWCFLIFLFLQIEPDNATLLYLISE